VTTCTIIIGVGGGDLPEVSGVPEGWTVILRDYESGNVPDENGDLYEDTVLIAGTGTGPLNEDAREMIVTALRRYATVGGDVGAEAAALARRIDNPTEVQR
jgi:hypothetical protein